MGFASEANIALDEAEADYAGMAGVSDGRMEACRKSEEEGEDDYGTRHAAKSHVSPPSGTLARLPCYETDGRWPRLRPSDCGTMVSPGAVRVKRWVRKLREL